MDDYKKLYLKLFNAVTTVIDLLYRGDSLGAEASLIRAQQECEERFIAAGENKNPPTN